MPPFPVHFTFHAGVSRPVFQHVRLVGSWDSEGRYSEQWSTVEMLEFRDESGCPAFQASGIARCRATRLRCSAGA